MCKYWGVSSTGSTGPETNALPARYHRHRDAVRHSELLSTSQTNIVPEIQPVAVEQEFLIHTGATQMPLKSYIDLIDDQGIIINHKAPKRSYPADAAEKDIELTAYALAYRYSTATPNVLSA